MTWYDGGNNLPEEKRAYKELLHGEQAKGSGLLIVGEKGSFYSVNDYGAEHILLPRDQYTDFKKPEQTLPRSPGHFTEFAEAISSGEPSRGHVELRLRGPARPRPSCWASSPCRAGSKIEWDAENMKAKNNPAADPYIRRDYRPGFSIH